MTTTQLPTTALPLGAVKTTTLVSGLVLCLGRERIQRAEKGFIRHVARERAFQKYVESVD